MIVLIKKTGAINVWSRKIFKWLIGHYAQTILFLLVIVAFFNYWSVFYIIAFLREALTRNSEKFGMNVYLLQAFLYGWVISILILFGHCLVLKYMLLHRKIKSVVVFLFLHVGYFFCLILFLVFA